MHPYTVYGIETPISILGPGTLQNCMHPYTVYGIETLVPIPLKINN